MVGYWRAFIAPFILGATLAAFPCAASDVTWHPKVNQIAFGPPTEYLARNEAIERLPPVAPVPLEAWLGTAGSFQPPPEPSQTAPPATEEQPLGDAPVDTSEVFLRRSTVLLKPGEGQWDIGLSYRWDEFLLPVQLDSGDLANEQLRDRQLYLPLNIRYGIADRTEVFAALPTGLAILERASADRDETTARFDAGDLTLGLKRLFREETTHCPDLIGVVSFTAPTGNHPFHPQDAAAIGGGFWSIRGALNVVKSYDPVVVFAGVGYSHEFEQQFPIGTIAPGEELDYSLGMGFAVNESIVFSTEFIGSLQTHAYLNDERIPNSLSEPMSLRLGMTQVIRDNRYFEPYVIFGLTPDAPDVEIGFISTFGFGRACEPSSERH